MTTKKISKPKPEKTMTRDEGKALASGLGSFLEDRGRDSLAWLILLLRWLAYEATDDDREEVYIWTEDEYLRCFDGVDEAVMAHLGRTLDTLRRRKGGDR